MITDPARGALLTAALCRTPNCTVTEHSDPDSQFTGQKWRTLLAQHNFEPGMSRRGICRANDVSDSFSHPLKRDRLRRRNYLTREAIRQDAFDCKKVV